MREVSSTTQRRLILTADVGDMTTAAWPDEFEPLHETAPVDASNDGRLRLVDRRADGRPLSFREHLALHGPVADFAPAALLAAVEQSGLTGRGGAAFPVYRKMSAVAAGAGPRVVVANAAEGEPASAKDKTLLSVNPHLTLDGLQLAARAVGAQRAFFYAHDDGRVPDIVRRAVHERRMLGVDEVAVEVVTAPAAFVAGEESAVASRISGGPALPRSKPPRVFEAGVHGRPTLVQNAETLAHLAVIARIGPEEFRTVGPADQPGTMLFTISGAVHAPGVVEAPVGVTIGQLLDRAGGPSAPVGAVLLGGYHGCWVGMPEARELSLANAMLRPVGLSVGAGVLAVLPAAVCGVAETARIMRYLAGESAQQCGPCVFGLPRLAATFSALAAGGGRRRAGRLDELTETLERRGGCAHPDGSVRFLRSARKVFAAELAAHAEGRCSAISHGPLLPTPGVRD